MRVLLLLIVDEKCVMLVWRLGWKNSKGAVGDELMVFLLSPLLLVVVSVKDWGTRTCCWSVSCLGAHDPKSQ